MVEGARLESEYTAKPYRGFESLRLRHFGIKPGTPNPADFPSLHPQQRVFVAVNVDRVACNLVMLCESPALIPPVDSPGRASLASSRTAAPVMP